MWKIEQVAEEIESRRLAQSPLIKRMIDIRDRYSGDVIVPAAAVDDDVPLSSLSPLLIADAVDGQADYASQAQPIISVPALDAASSRSTDYASRRRKAVGAVWDESWMDLLLARMYRHLAGYATSAMMVELDHQLRMPRVVIRDPLSAYPEPKASEDLTLPANVGFVTSKSLGWLHANFPETKEKYPRGSGWPSTGEELWDVVEWVDEDQILIGLLGPRNGYQTWQNEPMRWCMELSTLPNLIGRCPAVIFRLVTMDRIISQLANLIGHSDMIAMLTYLDIRATEKSIFPDRYIVGRAGQNPRIVSGSWEGGETGNTNIVIDAESIGELRGTPDPNNKQTLDRLERNLRVSSGLIPAQGGETYGALRTGRGIDSLMGAALDPRTTKLHRIGERYLSALNEIVLESFAKRWPERRYQVSFPHEPAVVEFIPGKHIETLNGIADSKGRPVLTVKARVSYPIPGMDDTNATVVIGQMLAAGLISQRDARRMHPHVLDPEGTERQVLVEQFEGLSMAGIGQRAQAGGIPPEDTARMVELAYEGKRLDEIIRVVNEEASARQAQQAPPAQPDQMMAPEAMPGLANPGEGAGMAPPPQIQGPNDSMQNLSSLVSALGQS
jgi:hypothetical protein